MYNRYLRNDHGTYTRITPPICDARAACYTPPLPPPPPEEKYTEKKTNPLQAEKQEKGVLEQLLKKLHLEDFDRADLMLLALIFFLFEEKADDELLIALGLLLIL